MMDYDVFLHALTFFLDRCVIRFTLTKAARATEPSLRTADEKHFLQLTVTEPAVLATAPIQPSLSQICA